MIVWGHFQTGLKIPFSEFWPLYLNAHRHPGTRAAHYTATALGGISTIGAIQYGQAGFMAAGITLSYALAVCSHWLIEGNQPLIRVNAFHGARADLWMCWLALTGRLGKEYRRLGLAD